MISNFQAEYLREGGNPGEYYWAAKVMGEVRGNATSEYLLATESLLQKTKVYLQTKNMSLYWTDRAAISASLSALCKANTLNPFYCETYTRQDFMEFYVNPLRVSERDVLDKWFDTFWNFGQELKIKAKIPQFKLYG